MFSDNIIIKECDQTPWQHPLTVFDNHVHHDALSNALTYFEAPSQEITDPGQFHKKTLSYRELHQMSSRIAAYLRNALGLRPGEAVGLCFNQGAHYVIWLLALWRAELVYLPFAWRDSETHDKTLGHIQDNLKRIGGRFLITDDEDISLSHSLITVLTHERVIKELPPNSYAATNLSPNATAYAICSSGTTGKPKMITIPHEGIVDRINAHLKRMNLQKQEPVLSFLSFEFDASLVEILMALLNGSNLIVVPPLVRRQQKLLPVLFQKQTAAPATAIFLPSQLTLFSQEAALFQSLGLKRVITTGESFKDDCLKPWFDAGIELFNGYGPSETTFGATLTQLKKGEPVSIHETMDGVRLLYWKSEEVDGNAPDEYEVVISGNGIGQYLDNPPLNRKHFLCFDAAFRETNHITDQEKLYRTFDIVRKQGPHVIFLRRTDNVLKRNGHQIFLDKVEDVLQKKLGSHLKSIIAAPMENGRGGLAVFIQPAPESRNIQQHISALIEEGLEELVNEMPNEWYLIDEFPVTQRGKTEKKYGILKAEASLIASMTMTGLKGLNNNEKRVAKIWAAILNLSKDHYPRKNYPFQMLGGNSLDVTRMLEGVWALMVPEEKRGLKRLPPPLFEYLSGTMTVEVLAAFVDLFNKIKLSRVDGEALFRFISPNKAVEKLSLTYALYAYFYLHHTDKEDFLLLTEECVDTKKLDELFPGRVLLCSEDNDKIDAVIQEMCNRRNQQHKDTLNKLLLQWKNQQLKNTYIADKLWSTQKTTLSTIEKFIEDPDKKICFLLGHVVTGKSTLCLKLLQEVDNRKVLYLSLKGYKTPGDLEKLLEAQGLHKEALTLLKNQPTLLLLDDYDLVAREDFPNIWLMEKLDEWQNLKVVIGCRHWYMADGRCWQAWDENILERIKLDYPSPDEFNENKHVTTLQEVFGFFSPFHLELYNNWHLQYDAFPEKTSDFNTYFLEAWFDREQKRSDIAVPFHETIATLQQVGKQRIISLALQPFLWTSGKPSLAALRHVTRHHDDMNILTGLLSEEEMLLRLSPLWAKWLTQYAETNRVSTAIASAGQTGATETSILKTVQQGQGGTKPVFAFSPLTGDLPSIYPTMARACRSEQTFYAFVLPEDKASAHHRDFNRRIDDYTAIITSLYPDPNDPRQEIILLGYSFGFIQAYATACQLLRKGYKIAALVNLDCLSPKDILCAPPDHDSLAAVFNQLLTLYQKSGYFSSDTIITQLKETIRNLSSKDEKNISNYTQKMRKLLSTEKDSRFTGILDNCESNWAIYLSVFEWFNEEKISIPITSWITTEKLLGLNQKASYDWSGYCKRHEMREITGNHFDFISDNFLEEWGNLLNEIQVPRFLAPLEQRINDYLMQQSKQFPEVIGYQETEAVEHKTGAGLKSVTEWVKCFIEKSDRIAQVTPFF